MKKLWHVEAVDPKGSSTNAAQWAKNLRFAVTAETLEHVATFTRRKYPSCVIHKISYDGVAFDSVVDSLLEERP